MYPRVFCHHTEMRGKELSMVVHAKPPTLRKLRQEDHHDIKARLIDIVSSRPVWST